MKYVRITLSVILAAVAMLATGCIRTYDKPEFHEVRNNETAFVIPLEGTASDGVAFDSEDYLNKRKVAQKRIQIPHRFNQTGRFSWEGEWIDTIRVITVDRSPVTRQWSPGKGSKDALWLESNDSIGFSTGFSVTAHVLEDDTARFLYQYKATSLEVVLDTELKARIQSIASMVAAAYKMDTLREKKNELIEKVKDDVIPFFQRKGITITTIGQFGGFEYENEKIQYAIDDTFVAQQAKVKNAAMLEAQADANARIESEAIALAKAAREKAKGEADGKFSVFEAEAKGITAVNQALAAANQNPQLIELKKLEVEAKRVERWNGSYPQWVMGEGGSNLLLNLTGSQLPK
jgi:SPFH domain / Band 7 family